MNHSQINTTKPWSHFLLTLFVLLSISTCHSSKKSPTTLPDEAEILACHSRALPIECTAEPSSLASQDLPEPFLKDVFKQTGLEGKLGRRVMFSDVNNDNYPDLVAIESAIENGSQHLFINKASPDGKGRIFVEVTQETGITGNRKGGKGQIAVMVAFGDVDNDGDLDLFSGSYSQDPEGERFIADSNELYLNDGKGSFTLKLDSGLNKPWPLTTTSAVFLDYNLDGNLDLFVGTFMVQYSKTYDKNNYPNLLYRGNGDGTFELVNDIAKISATGEYATRDTIFNKPTYGVGSCDYNNDGWPDLLVSNYALNLNDLWQNNRDGTFSNVSAQTNFDMDDIPAPTEPWQRQGGNTFATACADYDNDGDLDIRTAETYHSDKFKAFEYPKGSGKTYTRFYADRSRLLINTGKAGGWTFKRLPLAGWPTVEKVDGPTSGIDRWPLEAREPDGEYGNEGDHGVSWFDLNNDGLLDLVIEQSAYPHSHAWIFLQQTDHTFKNVTPQSGVQDQMVNSNGLTVNDYDRDGDLDIIMGSVNTGHQQAPGNVEQLHVFENLIGQDNHFLYVTLEGKTANRQGIGARVIVTAGCLTQMRELQGGKGSFGAANPAYAHFGLGKVNSIDRLEVHWPTNPPKTQVFTNLKPNQFLKIVEDQPALHCEPTTN